MIRCSQAINLYSLPIEIFTYLLLLLNFTAVGMVCICYIAIPRPESSTRCVESTSVKTLCNAYLVAMSLSAAWPFLEFTEGTVWSGLLQLTIYDVFAVLAPFGPLRYIINKHQHWNTDQMPGLVYRGEWFLLGLGDLIFYGVLIGRAALVDAPTVLTTTIAVCMGLIFTIISANNSSLPALPALPFSVALGLIFYFCTSPAIIGFSQELATSGVLWI